MTENDEMIRKVEAEFGKSYLLRVHNVIREQFSEKIERTRNIDRLVDAVKPYFADIEAPEGPTLPILILSLSAWGLNSDCVPELEGKLNAAIEPLQCRIKMSLTSVFSAEVTLLPGIVI